MNGKVGIIGAGGYTAGELLRILINHKNVTISYLASDSFSGHCVDKVHPFLKNLLKLKLMAYDPEEAKKSCELIFLAKPHPSSFKFAEELLDKGLKVVDLSSNFRLKDQKVFENWYGIKHECPQLLSKSVYGLPELYFEQIKGANLIANPGCYPAGIIIGLAPIIDKEFINTHEVVVDSVSGFSGAGRSGKNENSLAANVVANIKPYKVTNHPHVAEIEQELGKLCGKNIKITFVPHVAGFERGIINTLFLRSKGDISQDTLNSIFHKFYQEKPFVRICKDKNPEIKNVIHTNFCDIGVSLNHRTKTVIITTVLDNLVKGAAGQAVQNMNVMLGYNQEEGLGNLCL